MMSMAEAGKKKGFAQGLGLLAFVMALTVGSPLVGEERQDLLEGTRALYQGEYERARVLAARYLQAHPEDASALVLLARAEISEGKYSPAFDDLRKALRSDPENTDTLYYLGRVATLLSQVEFSELLQAAPDSFRAHQLLAESYKSQQDLPKAEAEYQAALRANPKSVEVLDALGDLKRSQYRFEEAATYYGRATQLTPRDYESWYGLGACALYQQEPERAIAYLRRAVQIDADSAAAHLALGDALLRAQQTSAAITELKAAVALRPDMRQAYTLLARAYTRLGQSKAAQEALEKEHAAAQAEIRGREKILGSNASKMAPEPKSPEQGPPKP